MASGILHNFYMTRYLHFDLFMTVKKRVLNLPNIKLVAVDSMSVDTMIRADRLDMATREDAAFLFLLKGFVDEEAANTCMSDFMDTLDEEE